MSTKYIADSLLKYIEEFFNGIKPEKILNYEYDGKYHSITLDYGDDEIIYMYIAEKDNAYRAVLIA